MVCKMGVVESVSCISEQIERSWIESLTFYLVDRVEDIINFDQ